MATPHTDSTGGVMPTIHMAITIHTATTDGTTVTADGATMEPQDLTLAAETAKVRG